MNIYKTVSIIFFLAFVFTRTGLADENITASARGVVTADGIQLTLAVTAGKQLVTDGNGNIIRNLTYGEILLASSEFNFRGVPTLVIGKPGEVTIFARTLSGAIRGKSGNLVIKVIRRSASSPSLISLYFLNRTGSPFRSRPNVGEDQELPMIFGTATVYYRQS